ncbi:MAG: hypothetical protein MJZ81_11915 [Bacteroidales bacterium]|nr:hypothetical protein [Bacteroidales bacterium]
MKGGIVGLEDWGYDEVGYCLEEAGLISITGRPYLYRCDGRDSVDVFIVIERLYDVEFSKTEINQLFHMMSRGFIGRCSFMNWLLKCNSKPKRKQKSVTQEMPLFAENKNCEVK